MRLRTDTKSAIRVAARKLAKLTHARQPMMFPTYSREIAEQIEGHADDVRMSSMALAIQRLEIDGIPGAFAELGVYRGQTSAFIHRQAPHRTLYLFDTFEGFPDRALDIRDTRFQDTSEEIVKRNIGDLRNVIFRRGYFPESAQGLEQEQFSFVLLDFDLYVSAIASLEFFYPQLVRGGYFFMHDFNSPESQRAISRAAAKFLADKPEMVIEMPDTLGSAVFRKV
jgi:O-methyltransferase